MPPISSSRLAPRTVSNSPAASICASQVRRSCLGALLSVFDATSAGRFMGWPFSSGAFEGAPRHGTDKVTPIVGVRIVVHKRVDGVRGGVRGGGEGVLVGRMAVEGGFRFRDAAWAVFRAANAEADVGHHAVLDPV